jgi:hypothetical protein
MHWDGQPGHYEVWYLTLSDPATQVGYWLRYTLLAPVEGQGAPSVKLWFARFDGRDPTRTFGVQRRLPVSALVVDDHPFRLRLGEAALTSTTAEGALRGGGHAVSWRLAWTPDSQSTRLLPSLPGERLLLPTRLVSPNLDIRVEGEICIDGETHLLREAPGGQTHLSGRRHAYAWAWAHCNAFEREEALLEALTARLRPVGVILPPVTLLTLRLGGETLRFNEWSHVPLGRSGYGTGRYWLRAQSPLARVEAELTCRPEDMLLAEYEDPDGQAAFCHNTECADARVTVWRRSPFVGRLRADRTLVSNRCAHYEWGARAGDPLVRQRHQLLVDERGPEETIRSGSASQSGGEGVDGETR